MDPFITDVKNELFTACKVGDEHRLQDALRSAEKHFRLASSDLDPDEQLAAILNSPFGEKQTTLLHVAAQAGSGDSVWELLRSGADPAIR